MKSLHLIFDYLLGINDARIKEKFIFISSVQLEKLQTFSLKMYHLKQRDRNLWLLLMPELCVLFPECAIKKIDWISVPK